MRAGELMRSDFEVVHPDESVAQVARRLSGSAPMPVCAGGRLLGLVRAEDLPDPARLETPPLRRLRVRDVIAPEVVFCLVDTDVDEAMMLMREYRLERLPVLDERRMLVGMPALDDVPPARNGSGPRPEQSASR